MPERGRGYPPEFRANAVQLHRNSDVSIRELAAELGIAGAARVKELGGEADAPAPVPGMGWFVTCKDIHGNEFGLWQTDPSAPEPTG